MRLWFAIRFPHLSLSALDVYDHNPSLFITDIAKPLATGRIHGQPDIPQCKG